MEALFYTIATGVLSTLLYETVKALFIFIKVKRERVTSTFNIDGYWTSLHAATDDLDGEKYESYELVHLKLKKGIVFVKIYQITSDGRTYMYRGNGLMRFDKLVISYEEVTEEKSNFLGTMMLRFSNEIEHRVILQGKYNEFRKNSNNSKSYPYVLREYKICIKEKIKFVLKGRKYIFQVLNEDEFKEACAKKV